MKPTTKAYLKHIMCGNTAKCIGVSGKKLQTNNLKNEILDTFPSEPAFVSKGDSSYKST